MRDRGAISGDPLRGIFLGHRPGEFILPAGARFPCNPEIGRDGRSRFHRAIVAGTTTVYLLSPSPCHALPAFRLRFHIRSRKHAAACPRRKAGAYHHRMSTKKDTYLEAERFIRENSLDEHTISREDLDFLIERYQIPLAQLAAMMNCLAETLIYKADRWGLIKASLPEDLRPLESNVIHRSKALKAGARRKYGSALTTALRFAEGLGQRKPTAENLRFLYSELKLPIDVIAWIFGKSGTSIRNWMDQGSLARRSGSESKRFHYNAVFFKTWSPSMAWVLGLLYTDGNLHKGAVALYSIDTELLEKVRDLVAPQATISEQRQSYNTDNRIGIFRIQHQDIVSDLIRLGLAERKSLNMEFPEIPDVCLRHFIRGCWDGDGGFAEANRKLVAHYTCGSRKFIETLANKLYQAGVVREILRANAGEQPEDVEDLIATYGKGPYPPTIYKRRNAQAFDLRIGLPRALERLHEYFYKDVDSSIYLSRKFAMLNSYVLAKRTHASN